VNDLIEKLTSYNLFNYLLPGTVFTVLADSFTHYHFIQSDLFLAFFTYYFAGMVISRLGSLVVEPCLKKFKFVTFAPYKDFVRCSTNDKKLDILSEANNTYRTIATVFIALGILKIAELLLNHFSTPEWLPPLLLCAFLFTLFLMAYRKQTKYIKSRVEANQDHA
jgi:hypothetical protein